MAYYCFLMYLEGAWMLSHCDIWRVIMDFRASQCYWFCFFVFCFLAFVFVFALPIFEVKFAKAEMTVYS